MKSNFKKHLSCRDKIAGVTACFLLLSAVVGLAVTPGAMPTGKSDDLPGNGMESALETGAIVDAPTEASETEVIEYERDPFSPVGYVPKRRVVVTETEEAVYEPELQNVDWAEARKIINGNMVGVGDAVVVEFEDVVYMWTVDSISSGGVRIIPLRTRTADMEDSEFTDENSSEDKYGSDLNN